MHKLSDYLGALYASRELLVDIEELHCAIRKTNQKYLPLIFNILNTLIFMSLAVFQLWAIFFREIRIYHVLNQVFTLKHFKNRIFNFWRFIILFGNRSKHFCAKKKNTTFFCEIKKTKEKSLIHGKIALYAFWNQLSDFLFLI